MLILGKDSVVSLYVVCKQGFSGPSVTFSGPTGGPPILHQITYPKLNDVYFGVANSYACMIQHPICTSRKLQYMHELHQPMHIPTDS